MAVLWTAAWILTVGVLVAVGEMSRPIAGFALAVLAIGGLVSAAGYLVLGRTGHQFASWRLEAAALCMLFAVEQSLLLGIVGIDVLGLNLTVFTYPAFACVFAMYAVDCWRIQQRQREAVGYALFLAGILLVGITPVYRHVSIVAMVPLVAAIVVLFRSNDREGDTESPGGQ